MRNSPRLPMSRRRFIAVLAAAAVAASVGQATISAAAACLPRSTLLVYVASGAGARTSFEVKKDGTAYIDAAPPGREKVDLTENQYDRLRSLVRGLKRSYDGRVFRATNRSISRIEARRGAGQIKFRISGLAHTEPRPPYRVKRLVRYLKRLVSDAGRRQS